LIKDEKVISVKYKWFFKQLFFVNFQESWKINEDEGGGIFFNYLIHLIYNLITLFKEIKILELVKKSNNKYKKTDYLLLKLLCNKTISCEIEISNNAISNTHHLKIKTKHNIIELINNSKDWTNKFKLIKNDKIKLNFKNKISNERYAMTLRNIKELLNYKSTLDKKYLHNLSKIITSHKITKSISLKN